MDAMISDDFMCVGVEPEGNAVLSCLNQTEVEIYVNSYIYMRIYKI